MGQCGCNDIDYERRFPGPYGTIYALEIHPGCPYCHTPVGIAIHCLGFEQQSEMEELDPDWVDDLPELEFVEYGPDWGVGTVPILDPEILKRIALRYVEGDGERILIEDALEHAHIDAVEGTVAAWEARS